MAGLIAVQGYEGACGLITWWSLSGLVDYRDLKDEWEAAGLPVNRLPQIPSVQAATQRAIEAACQGQVARSPRPGVFEIETYQVTKDAADRVTGQHRKDSRIEVNYTEKTVKVEAYNDAGTQFESRFQGSRSTWNWMLTTVDISNWLVERATMLHAVSLRDRGGFYYIPTDRVQMWDEIRELLQKVSGHKIAGIPAMKTDEAVEIILSVVRREAETAIGELEEYLCGEPSTRGLNSWEKRVAEQRAKLAHYADLLGVVSPDIDAKLTALSGCIQAARLQESK